MVVAYHKRSIITNIILGVMGHIKENDHNPDSYITVTLK